MNTQIVQWIESKVQQASETQGETLWETPLVAVAAAGDPLFGEIRKWVQSTHQLPQELLSGAQSVITYFIPFHPTIPKSNRKGRLASREWGQAYILTNHLIGQINDDLTHKLSEAGYQTAYASATHNFDESTLMSNWSHRHVAYIAGLGNFGLNNMLITDKGCCGRIGTLVTTAPLTPTVRTRKHTCLYRFNGSCGLCVDSCVNGSLKENNYDRHVCYDMLLENAETLAEIGLADVCGKCTVGLPCSLVNPVKLP